MRLSLKGRLYGFPPLKGEMQMYSPKIKEDLIPTIYRLSKENKAPMTKVVDGILRSALNGSRSPSKEKLIIHVGTAKREESSASDLIDFLKGRRLIMDCGHKFCLHPLSNTLVLTCNGKCFCHECYF
jgi:hypothetical protein